MSKWVKRVLSVILACMLLGGTLSLGAGAEETAPAAEMEIEGFIPISIASDGPIQTQSNDSPIQVQSIAAQAAGVDAILHYWWSTDCFPNVALGRTVPDHLVVGTRYYLNFELLEKVGAGGWDDYNFNNPSTLPHINKKYNLQYNVTLNIYYPSDRAPFSHTYQNSDQNWISTVPDTMGIITFDVIITGDISIAATGKRVPVTEGTLSFDGENAVWNDAFFSPDPNSSGFPGSQNWKNLAIVSSVLSGLAYGDNGELKDAYKTLGLEHIDYHNEPSSGWWAPGYAFGHKTIVRNGTTKELVVAVFRGTHGFLDGVTDLSQVVGGINGTATTAAVYLNKYLRTCSHRRLSNVCK